MKSSNKFSILIILLLLGGAAAITLSYLTRIRTVSQIHRMLHSHVNSVAALVKKSVSQGTWSTATIYSLYEERMLTTANLLASLDDTRQWDSQILDSEQITVFLPSLSVESRNDHWGGIPKNKREAFRDAIGSAPLYELLDDPLLHSLGLVCMGFESETDIAAFCHNDASLNRLKKESGIGPLLNELVMANLSWVVLQDAGGILAAAPSEIAISRWRDDADLAQVAQRKTSKIRSTDISGIAHIESLSPFPMVDGSTAVLRVAVNAAVFDEIKNAAHHRHYVTVGLVAVIETLLIGIAIAFQRWRRKQREIAHTLALQEEDRKHWELIGGLSATVAHEVRNPLNTISMTGDRLKFEFNVPEEERPDFDHLLDILKKEATQLNRIVTDFLELGKPNQLQTERTHLGAFVEELAAHFMPRAATEDKQIRTVIESAAVAVVDRRRFQQILTNLINNALDACKTGGTVTLRVSEDDSAVILHVSDDGVGMTEEQLARALEPFVSFKANGTGLGLALVARLTRLHNGQFTLTPNAAGGMTAEIRIPQSRKGTI